ncbi:MAG TPA: alkaline phosphatase family protein [Symbiobacteriaceae bacterium]|nr:alkaline phosphatase family protein [Symbiobacteriaceae bacterium]
MFIDGFGLGDENPETNPLLTARMPALRSLLGGRPLTRAALPLTGPDFAAVPADARLGVEGLPQSATGQTTIFTGVNAARAIGRHLHAYPTPSLKAILEAHSVFRKTSQAGLKATFLNAFRPQFFDWVDAGQPLPKDKRYRPSASTLATLAGGLHCFRTLDQLKAGEAVAFDIDHSVMRELGHDLEPVAPAEAGRRAAAIAGQHDFTLYEHFLTDKAGHSQDRAEAEAVLERLDGFLGGLLAATPPDLLLVITSDHGNIEDLSVRTHTYSDVPVIAKGPGAEAFAARIRSLTDITPAILTHLTGSDPSLPTSGPSTSV